MRYVFFAKPRCAPWNSRSGASHTKTGAPPSPESTPCASQPLPRHSPCRTDGAGRHRAAYYRKGAKFRPTEVFANLTAANGAGPAGARIAEILFPKTYAETKKGLEEVVRRQAACGKTRDPFEVPKAGG